MSAATSAEPVGICRSPDISDELLDEAADKEEFGSTSFCCTKNEKSRKKMIRQLLINFLYIEIKEKLWLKVVSVPLAACLV